MIHAEAALIIAHIFIAATFKSDLIKWLFGVVWLGIYYAVKHA